MDQFNILKNVENVCLTSDQARHIYKKVESESVVNVDTMKCEKEVKSSNRYKIEEDDKINPYHEIVINKAEK